MSTRYDNEWATESSQRGGVNEFLIAFPNIVDGKIDTKKFLTASRATLKVIDKFGKVFAPIKYDMQSNIEKIMTKYAADKDKHATLQDLIMLETKTNKKMIIVEALVWLARGLRMIQLFLANIVEGCKVGESQEDLVANIKESYREALEPHHGWMAHQLFGLLSRMVPSRSQLLLTLANNHPNEEITTLCAIENFERGLKINLMTLQCFLNENHLGIIL